MSKSLPPIKILESTDEQFSRDKIKIERIQLKTPHLFKTQNSDQLPDLGATFTHVPAQTNRIMMPLPEVQDELLSQSQKRRQRLSA